MKKRRVGGRLIRSCAASTGLFKSESNLSCQAPTRIEGPLTQSVQRKTFLKLRGLCSKGGGDPAARSDMHHARHPSRCRGNRAYECDYGQATKTALFFIADELALPSTRTPLNF